MVISPDRGTCKAPSSLGASPSAALAGRAGLIGPASRVAPAPRGAVGPPVSAPLARRGAPRGSAQPLLASHPSIFPRSFGSLRSELALVVYRSAFSDTRVSRSSVCAPSLAPALLTPPRSRTSHHNTRSRSQYTQYSSGVASSLHVRLWLVAPPRRLSTDKSPTPPKSANREPAQSAKVPESRVVPVATSVAHLLVSRATEAVDRDGPAPKTSDQRVAAGSGSALATANPGWYFLREPSTLSNCVWEALYLSEPLPLLLTVLWVPKRRTCAFVPKRRTCASMTWRLQ